MKSKTPYIEQMEHSECGLACFGMILGNLGHHITLPELRYIFGSSKKGISLHNLVSMGSQFKLEGQVYEADIPALKTIDLPAILFWENTHYVILDKISRNGHKFTIIDPAFGRRTLKLEEFSEKFSDFILTYSVKEGFIKKEKKFKLNFLLTHVLKHKKVLIFLIMASLLLQSIGLLLPKFTQWVTDEVILSGNEGYINLIGFSVLALYILYQSFSLLRGYMIARFQTLIDSSLMTSFIKKLFSLPFSFFEARTSGDLIHRANSNFFIREILSSGLIALIIDTLLIVGYVIMMFFLSWKLTIVAFILSCLLITNILLSTKFIRQISFENLTDQSKTQSFLTEGIYGISDVKVLSIEKKVFENWKYVFKKYLKTEQKRNILSSSLESIGNSIQFITPLVLLWLGISMILKGSLSLGELLAFIAFANAFMIPIVSMGSTYSQFVMLGAYAQRLQDVVDTDSERKGGLILKDFKGKVELENVSFVYDYFSEDVLKSIDFVINPGEKIAIVGQSGSGKSSLAKILLGLNYPTGGRLTYDNIDINELDLQLLRKKVGSVLQETRLFHGSILENIQAFDKTIPFERVEKVAKVAEIHEDIMQQPMGYHTVVAEGGSNFSGGQRQRLLLARALVNNPRLLVLDEATSALDNITESKIKENLESLKCTQILIAHRLSTVINSDRILVMNSGVIIESGTHEELLNQRGFYYNLYFSAQEEENKELLV